MRSSRRTTNPLVGFKRYDFERGTRPTRHEAVFRSSSYERTWEDAVRASPIKFRVYIVGRLPEMREFVENIFDIDAHAKANNEVVIVTGLTAGYSPEATAGEGERGTPTRVSRPSPFMILHNLAEGVGFARALGPNYTNAMEFDRVDTWAGRNGALWDDDQAQADLFAKYVMTGKFAYSGRHAKEALEVVTGTIRHLMENPGIYYLGDLAGETDLPLGDDMMDFLQQNFETFANKGKKSNPRDLKGRHSQERTGRKTARYRRNPDYKDTLVTTLLENGARLYTYDTLLPPAKAAATEYLEDPQTSDYLVGELPTKYVKRRIVSEWSEPFAWPSFDAYHRWYVEKNEQEGRMPNYPLKGRWPSLLAGRDKEGFLWDGWHRFHAYVRSAHPTVPVYMLVSKKDAEALRRGNARRINPTDLKGRHIPERYLAGLPTSVRQARRRELTASRDAYRMGDYSELPSDRIARKMGLVKQSPYSVLAEVRGIEWRGSEEEMARRVCAHYRVTCTPAVARAIRSSFNKGLAAWKSGGHRPGATAQNWAVARVASLVVGGKTSVTADRREFAAFPLALQRAILKQRPANIAALAGA